MKKLTLVCALFISSIAFADCPNLTGSYQFGPKVVWSIKQDQCATVTFEYKSEDGDQIVTRTVDGSPQPTEDGSFEKLEWHGNSLIETPLVDETGKAIPGLVYGYSLTAQGDLQVQLTLEMQPGQPQTKTDVYKRISQ